jgi:lambda family phage portal protein
MDWQGQQAVVAEELIEAGECLARDRFRRRGDQDAQGLELLVPYQVQLLEPDFLDETYTLPLDGGRSIRMGIEFDSIGRRRAYHLWQSHPGDVVPMSGQGGFDRVPVPAEQVRHVFHVERAGQIRALPWFSPVILRLYELSQYDDAQLVRQKLAAMYTGHLFPDAGAGPSGWPGTNDGTKTPAGAPVMDWEPGLFQVVPPGFGRLEFSSPPDPGAHFDEFTKFHLRAFAAGLGPITFEQVSNNFADMNFSTLRAGLQEVRELAEMIVWKTMIFQFCRPTAIRWLDQAVLSGAVQIRDYFANRAKYTDVTWIPPKKAYLDPVKDWAADIMSIRAGLRAPQDVILGRGEDPDEVLEKIAEWNQKLIDRGIVSDANPAQTGQGGKVQTDAVLAAVLASELAGQEKAG